MLNAPEEKAGMVAAIEDVSWEMGGVLFSIDPSFVFWMGSGAALLLMLLLVVAKPKPNLGPGRSPMG